MPRRSRSDLSPREFRDALLDNAFAYLGGSVDRFVDLMHPKARRYVHPVKDGRGRMQRRATLEALKAARAAFEAELAAKRLEEIRAAALLERIVPTALPPARASLEGAQAIHQMAEDLRTMATRGDGVTAFDLRRVGWTNAQISAHVDAARELGYERENGVAA
ncbi:phospholipase [Bradyrhizobium manausense]|uniref:phospholipase n=1 Tax=Bradyrhizobium manausense TaxID=989370 RepID=UPI001BA799EE|nr:phospholipase [Bradyrhizobium manausense]MBR0687301.1 phospholipase [Bradyrhizobium manausense]